MKVWSDPEIQKLAREFVCGTEEVDILFPRNKWLINRLKNDPAVKLFRDIYGKQVPRKHWDPDPKKTKQGVYAMMPDGTYLSARFVGARPQVVKAMMREALTTWRNEVKERKLNPKPVPQKKALSAWRDAKAQELGLLMQLHYRDLPRKTKKTGNGKTVGKRHNTAWIEFSKPEAAAFIPPGKEWHEVAQPVRNKFFHLGLKDIVYGQSPKWKEGDIRSGSLKARRISSKNGQVKIQLAGEFDLKDAKHQFKGRLLGELI